MEDFLRELNDGALKAIDHLKSEYANIQTGRASTGLVSEILIDAYGAKTPLKQVANITVTDAKTLNIQPWDKENLNPIESALRNSDASLSVVNAGDVIHASVPDLTEERRNKYVKIAKEKAEEAKVSVRNSRGAIWDATKKAKTDGEISEDEMYRREKEINQFVEGKNKEIDSIYSDKEEELRQV